MVGYPDATSAASGYVASSDLSALADCPGEARRIRRGSRLHFARELHDRAGWHLAALNYGLSAAERDPGNPERLREVRQRLDDLSAALRELSRQSRRDARLRGSLAEELATLGHSWTGASGVPVRVRIDLPRGAPSPEIAGALVAVAREALTNVAKHAPGASGVAVSLRDEGGLFVLEIRDDGPGLSPPRPCEVRSGQGILGMGERVALVGGTLGIRNGAQGGAVLTAAVPRRRAR